MSGQYIAGPTQKPFNLYNQQSKTFQTYSQIQANNTFPGQSKDGKTKIEET